MIVKKFQNVGFEDVQTHDRRPFGLDDLARYPLFTPEFLAFMRAALPPERHRDPVFSLVVTAVRPVPPVPASRAAAS